MNQTVAAIAHPVPSFDSSAEFCAELAVALGLGFGQRFTDNSPAFYAWADEAARAEDEAALAALPPAAERWQNAKESLLRELQHKSLLYSLLEDDASRARLVELAAYGVLGHRHVRLSYHQPDNIARRAGLARQCDISEQGDPALLARLRQEWKSDPVCLFDLKPAGGDILLYTHREEMFRALTAPNYMCPTAAGSIYPRSGDIVLDCGASFGDVALQFASAVGPKGRVYAFEPYPEVFPVLRANLGLNPDLAERISHIPRAAYKTSNETVRFFGWGGGSRIDEKGVRGGAHTVMTQAIDDFVRQHELPRVDFIKMDIEGAECAALEGTLQTLRAYKPVLAIAIYHRERTDFLHVPRLLHDLHCGYAFYLNHHAVNAWDTVLYATPRG